MKKLFLTSTSVILAFQMVGANVFAAAPTPTKIPTPTGTQSITQIEQQINSLKDKIASRVAQLKLVEKRGTLGVVTDTSETQITLKDAQGNLHFVDVDELTQFSSPSVKSNFGISDITKNMTLGILGLYNKDSRRLLARFVTVTTVATQLNGAIADIDKKNFTITLVQADGTQTPIEIEDVTKITSYDKTTGTTKTGFSKLVVGQRIHVTGYPDKQDPKQIIAARVIVLPTVPVNPAIANVAPVTPTDSPTPTLTPTKTSKY